MALLFPHEDLTCNNFGKPEYETLSDRQYFAWAYQTETKIRFQKLQARNAPTSEHKSTTLKSDFLIDVYPSTTVKGEDVQFKNLLERDRSAFARKAAAALQAAKEPDGSLRSIEIRGDRPRNYALSSTLFVGSLPVPPNFLYFEMCLKAFTGYNLVGLYNSKDPTLPRAAMMGGAVVAALTGWRDYRIISIIEESNICEFFERLREETIDLDRYSQLKMATIKRLHEHFHKSQGRYSPFYAGDVDLFLQMAPSTRQLVQRLLQQFSTDIHDTIQKFHSTGLGACHNDLYRFSEAVMERLQRSLNKDADGKFVHALAQNGLSFIIAPGPCDYFGGNYYDENEQEENELWSRPTQLIMLQPGADLLGAIMDFDISIACCAYDGTSVRVTPRAALSLVRMLVTVTPFCFEEKRNRTRVLKYYDRGFLPAIIDPNCRHLVECQNCDSVLGQTHDAAGALLSGGAWRSRSFHSDAQYDNLLNRIHDSHDELEYCCCPPERAGTCHLPYSMAVFEQSEGHATEFFARLFDWTAEKRQQVESIPNHKRLACRRCRNDYSMHLFLKEETPVDDSDDILRLDKSFMKTIGGNGTLGPSFYAGPVFDCVRVWDEARNYNEARSAIQGQSHAERIRYIIKHGSEEGYRPRIIFPIDPDTAPLEAMFAQAAQHEFPTSGRPPIGLNPERILSRCQSCGDWLHHCEFGTEHCGKCSLSLHANKRPKR